MEFPLLSFWFTKVLLSFEDDVFLRRLKLIFFTDLVLGKMGKIEGGQHLLGANLGHSHLHFKKLSH